MRSFVKIFAGLSLAVSVSGCAVAPAGVAQDDVFDPYEDENRRVHEFNRQLDAKLFRAEEESQEDTPIIPPAIKTGVSNLSETLSLPRSVVNQVLQGRLVPATENSLRFLVNATLGLGGVLDVASDMGLAENDSNFGETLSVWGVNEGAYLELPILGPSTQRDAAGQVVDLFTNPLVYVLDWPWLVAWGGVKVADKAFQREEYGDLLDSVLYGSADSYTQFKLIYVQTRRYELGVDSASEDDVNGEDPLALDTSGF